MAKSVTKEALEQMVTLQKGYIDKGDRDNSQAIEALEKVVKLLKGYSQDHDEAIEALETQVAQNDERIAQNAQDIANNAENIASKQPAITASNDIAPLGADKLALTTPAKYSAFDDVWVRLCGTDGGLDYSHTENNISKPYRLNGLWLTRNEAIDIVSKYRTWGTKEEDVTQTNIRTNIPIKQSSKRTYANSFNNIEVANLQGYLPNVLHACFIGDNLTSIINFNAQFLTSTYYSCFRAPNLVTFDISNLKISLNLSKCPLINFTSWQGLVTRAANTDAITITVHPDVYAKLTDEQADATALLPENLLEGTFYDLGHSTAIDNGVELTSPQPYFRITHSPRLVDKGLGKLTVSCDVEGLNEGESITFAIGGANDVMRPRWTISANGRAVFSFDAAAYTNDSTSRNGFLLYDITGTYTGQGLKLTNFKLSYGEHDTLPYTAPLSSVTDTELREKAEWLSLMQIAEARQINFITTA